MSFSCLTLQSVVSHSGVMEATCPGPLMWYDVPGPRDRDGDNAALMECHCGYLCVSATPLDHEHARTPIHVGR